MYKKICRSIALGLTAISIFSAQTLSAFAANDIEIRLENQRNMTVQSNEVDNWPTGPVVSAESAILIEAGTGAVLYAKNVHQQEYPASTTKILTTLIAAEQCAMDEIVTFSHDAVFDIDPGSNNIAIDEGEQLTMEQCLNAILIRSANEVSFAVAEHISGSSWEDFAPIMNKRAKELGCVDSNFVNPNGLPNDNHYSSAYDLAMIGRAFFANETLCKMSTSTLLHIPPSEHQPDDILESSSNQLLQGRTYAYQYLVGAKTGYTNAARSCLVSCAEKDGLKLICVVMKDESPLQYEDTISLFDYGFSNFEKINISQTETKYNIDNTGFYSENDIFGNSKPILSLNKNDYLILPKTASFEDTVSTISYDTAAENQAAVISYTYHDVFIGSANLDFASTQEETYAFDTNTEGENAEIAEEKSNEPPVIFINIVKVLLGLVALAAVVFLLLLLRAFLKNYEFAHRNSRSSWRRNRKKRQNRYQTVNSSLRARRKAEIKQAKQRRKAKRPNRFRDYDS